MLNDKALLIGTLDPAVMEFTAVPGDDAVVALIIAREGRCFCHEERRDENKKQTIDDGVTYQWERLAVLQNQCNFS